MQTRILCAPTPKTEVNMPQSTTARQRPPADTKTSASTGQKPVDKFRDGPVHVSIWENQGSKGDFRSASFELRYKDSQKQWQSGHSYTDSSLLHLEKAANEARARIEKWRQESAAKRAAVP
jgi:hypothetical protein